MGVLEMFENYIEYASNLSELSEYANEKGVVQVYFGYLKGKYRKFFAEASNTDKVKFGIRMYRAQKEMLCSSQMLMESQISMKNGCSIGYFFLCYYALFHAMQANLFIDTNIANEVILQLPHSRIESYFEDFYCKGSRSIMPHEIIDLFKQLRGFREIYSYDMPFNNPSNVDINMEQLRYFIIMCFQLCNLKSHIVGQVQGTTRIASSELIEIRTFFEGCCYKKSSVTGQLLKDVADEIYFGEIRNQGIDFVPFSISIDHLFDEYGGYDESVLKEAGFENIDKVRSEAFRFYYSAIV